MWSDAGIINVYTRRQAIEDGVLVQLSGHGYQGDPWAPAMVAEAGFRYAVAMTAHLPLAWGDNGKSALGLLILAFACRTGILAMS